MANSDSFMKTEAMLYNYYKDSKRIIRIKNKIEILEYKRNKLAEDLRETRVNLETDIQAISYDRPAVQSSRDGTSQAEKELIRLIEKLEEKLLDIQRDILKKKALIIDIESQNADIQYVISLMPEETRQFINLKYGEGASLYTISAKLPMSKTTAARRREEIVKSISFFFNYTDKNGVKVG